MGWRDWLLVVMAVSYFAGLLYAAYVLTRPYPVLPSVNVRLVIRTALTGARVRRLDEGGYQLELKMNHDRLLRMLPHADKAVSDGLMTQCEAARLLAQECCGCEEESE